MLDILRHSNPGKYPNQRVFVVAIGQYARRVPFVEEGRTIFRRRSCQVTIGDRVIVNAVKILDEGAVRPETT